MSQNKKPVVVKGTKFAAGLKVTAIRTKDRSDAGERTAIMLDLGNRLWGRLRVANFPSLERDERDAMLAAVNVNDTFPFDVVVCEDPRQEGTKTLIELSAKDVLLAERDAARKATADDRRSKRDAYDAEVAAAKKGTLVTGTVKSVAPYGVFVEVGQLTGLLHLDNQAEQKDRPADAKVLVVGSKVEVVLMEDAVVQGRNVRMPLSEKLAVVRRAELKEAEKAAAKAEQANALRPTLKADGATQYAAQTVVNHGPGKGVTVAIEGLVPAFLADADMLGAVVDGDKVTVKTRGSVQSPGQRLTVVVTSIDGETVTVKQAKKGK